LIFVEKLKLLLSFLNPSQQWILGICEYQSS